MKVVVRHVGVLKSSIIAAMLYGLIGLVLVPFMLLMLLVAPEEEGALGAAFGMVFVFFLPVIYAVLGFVSTALLCLMYNLLSRMIGGVEVTLSEVAAPVSTPVPAAPEWANPA